MIKLNDIKNLKNSKFFKKSKDISNSIEKLKPNKIKNFLYYAPLSIFSFVFVINSMLKLPFDAEKNIPISWDLSMSDLLFVGLFIFIFSSTVFVGINLFLVLIKRLFFMDKEINILNTYTNKLILNHWFYDKKEIQKIIKELEKTENKEEINHLLYEYRENINTKDVEAIQTDLLINYIKEIEFNVFESQKEEIIEFSSTFKEDNQIKILKSIEYKIEKQINMETPNKILDNIKNLTKKREINKNLIKQTNIKQI